jgi:hypothetical protein
MPKKIYKTKKTVGMAGKNPTKNLETNKSQIKRDTGAVLRKKKGAIIRKPVATIRYKRKSS